MICSLNPTRRQLLQSSAAALLGGVLAKPLFAEDAAKLSVADASIIQQAENAPLAMKFKGETADDCRRWQTQFAAQLRKMLGPHRQPKKWETIVERVVELEDHRREELLLVAPGHPPLPVYVLSPLESSAKPRAGVVAIHGHGQFGYDTVAGRDEVPEVAEDIEKLNYDYGRQLVRRGYVVAAPCLTPFGRRLGNSKAYGNQDPCAVTFVRMQLLGKLLMAENLRDCLWAVELLSRRKEVNAQKLGCVGLSYGGRMTMLTTALEPRIRAATVSGALNVMQERIMVRYNCGGQVIPGLLQYGDIPEIASLIAPRPCVWEIGSTDGLIKPKWAAEALKRMGRAYRAFDVEDRLQVDRFEGGHQWSGQLAYPMLDKALRG